MDTDAKKQKSQDTNSGVVSDIQSPLTGSDNVMVDSTPQINPVSDAPVTLKNTSNFSTSVQTKSMKNDQQVPVSKPSSDTSTKPPDVEDTQLQDQDIVKDARQTLVDAGSAPTTPKEKTPDAQPDKKSDPLSAISVEDFQGKTIADILQEKGELNPEQVKEMKYELASQMGSEEEILKQKGWVTEDDIIRAKAASYGIPFVDLTAFDIQAETVTKLPYDLAKAHRAIVFDEDGEYFHIGMEDPLDIQRVRFLESILKRRVKVYFASKGDIQSILDTRYAGHMESEVTEAVEEVGEGVMEIKESIQDIGQVDESIASAPVARIVNMMLEYAVKFKASDIHIEPREKRMVIRFRINGIMMERLQLPMKLIPSVVSRIKILSDLKIDEHRVPQDGRFQIRVGKKEVDLRVSIMPTVHGEKVVIRLLEKGAGLMKLEETGLRGSGYKLYREGLNNTQGIILVTGPTGSGKTLTLASSLTILNKPDVNIMTLEDPVEIKVDGVNQIQVNSEVGLSFSKGLRSTLRQNPDIIMVGEIRDEETVELAIQAALTGHLVLATLHTNSASGALPRLLDMNVEPYLITSTVNLIVGQRLVRTICERCKESYKASPELVKEIHKGLAGLKGFDRYSYPKRDNTLAQAGKISTTNADQVPPSEVQKQKQAQGPEEITLYRGKGCNKCDGTGYSGRIGIFEVLRVSDKIAQLIMEHRSSNSIEKQAIEEGMITMIQDGYMKALEGVTTLEEVMRVQKK